MNGQSTRKRTAEGAIGVSKDTNALPMPKIRVFVLLQNRLMRDVLIRVLRRRNLEVVGCGSREEVTAEDVTKSGCDVLLLDSIDLKWASRIKVDIQSVGRPIKIVVIGIREGYEQFLQAICCGVTEYLLNDPSLDDTVAAIRAAARGRKALVVKYERLSSTTESIADSNSVHKTA